MPEHPDGPRTLWTQVRDGLPLTQDAVARGLALEQGRHPTLTAIRNALGLDLDLTGVAEAARSVRLPREGTPTDDLLKHYIDSMYRGLASSRLVRIVVSDAGIAASRADGPVALRAGERLNVLVLLDNQTELDVEFSAALAWASGRGTVEARRTASLLLDAGVLTAEITEIELSAEVGGERATQLVPLDVAPAWTLTAQIVDEESGEPVAARVYLTDDRGAAWPEDAYVRRDEHENAFFHADGRFEATVSGSAQLVVARGMEYEPLEVTVEASGGGQDLRVRRWSNMAARGWRGGDVHVHLHYGGEYLLSPEDASLVQRGEDVSFMNMMVANQGSAFVHDRNYFEGRPHSLSDADHILRWGEEYRNDFYGHLCMYGIRELVPPIYSGFRLSEHPHDLPANAVAADRCHEAGGTLSYAHPLFASGALERVFARPRTVEAKELPVDVALGKVDALDVMSYPSVDLETCELWYRLLNCGFRLPATAGTDTFMNFAGTGIFSNPPAGNRVFVDVEGDFTTESWCEGIRAGRTFVTNGAMLSMTVDGHSIGATLDAEPGAALYVQAEARSFVPVERLQLIVNGEVVAEGEVVTDDDGGGRHATLATPVDVASDGWIAVRALGSPHPRVLGGPLFAHSSPVYVSAGVANPRAGEAARYFVDWIERLIALCHEHGRYAAKTEFVEIERLFRSAQAEYERIASAK